MSAATQSPNGNLLLCYNKGCGKLFDTNNNTDDSCQFHPGNPVFHDALKGWSCCNKKSTDFTQFLNIPGCSKSAHSNQKPVEPEKPAQPKEISNKEEVITYEVRKPPEPTPRPTNDEPLVDLRRTIAPTLTSTLEKLSESFKSMPLDDKNSTAIEIGTPCKNSTCQAKYEGEKSNSETCTYHPGTAIFHEGMKYWSCCQRKTSDFNSFLNQAGCTEGNHVWTKQEVNGERVDCRYDHHQTGGFVIVTVYSKNPVPDKTVIKGNSIKLSIDLTFEGGKKTFAKDFDLFGVVKLNESVVNFFPSKVEIKLKKADVMSWSKLEYVPTNK